MPIDAVLFDFDGTLADTLPLSFKAFNTVFKTYDNREVTNEELIAMFGPTEEEIIANHFRNEEFILQAIMDYYAIYKQGHFDTIEKDQAIIDLLEHLKGKGIRIGVITGKSRRAFQISSEALDLISYFDVVITGDDVVKPKPDPEGIYKALEILGVNKSKTVFIGDSNADIVAGKSAGLRTYGVQWLSTFQSSVFDIPPDAIFRSVAEFLDIMKEEG